MIQHALKNRVIELRKEGKSYSEINSALGVKIPQSTLSYWCHRVTLPENYAEIIRGKIAIGASKGRAIALVTNEIRRKQHLETLKQNNNFAKDLFKNNDVAKIALAMLYLGEGLKWKAGRALRLGSSDPDIVKIYIKLLRQCYGIKSIKLRARIGYRADQDINELTKYWSKITDLPRSSFYKTKTDPRTIGKPTKDRNYKGVCSIHCAGTNIQLELDIIARMILNDDTGL